MKMRARRNVVHLYGIDIERCQRTSAHINLSAARSIRLHIEHIERHLGERTGFMNDLTEAIGSIKTTVNALMCYYKVLLYIFGLITSTAKIYLDMEITYEQPDE